VCVWVTGTKQKNVTVINEDNLTNPLDPAAALAFPLSGDDPFKMARAAVDDMMSVATQDTHIELQPNR